jgi:hypothetical protein
MEGEVRMMVLEEGNTLEKDFGIKFGGGADVVWKC